ncbi:MAG: hypothetical protein KF851_05115 [Pirellulaceae bacterium]|nr:hypothetical protein [Pirellulaceae bacterium]
MKLLHLIGFLATSLVFLLPQFGQRATADIIVIERDAVITSVIYEPNELTPEHYLFAHHLNYNVGYYSPPGFAPHQRRNFFLFNLADIDSTIIGARLELFMPQSGYSSPDPSELFRITSSAAPPWTFYDAFLGLPSVTPAMIAAMYATLGTGTIYGEVDITPPEDEEPWEGYTVSIDFTAEGILALNSALSELFVIGGRLVDIHPESPGIPPSELVFAHTNVGAGTPEVPMPKLILFTTAVPEPSSGTLVILFSVVVLLRKRRES